MFQQCLCRNIFKYGIQSTRTQSLTFNSARQQIRFVHKKPLTDQEMKKRTTINYLISGIALTAGMTFAAVPLYRAFCQAYSYGGTTKGIVFNFILSNFHSFLITH